MTTKNARFWVWANGQFTKITLKPGQTLEHFVGGPDDEGFSCHVSRWEHEGCRVVNEEIGWGRDCDGRWERFDSFVCRFTKLRAGNNVFVNAEDEKLLVSATPCWERLDSSQRDYSAEAMGY